MVAEIIRGQQDTHLFKALFTCSSALSNDSSFSPAEHNRIHHPQKEQAVSAFPFWLAGFVPRVSLWVSLHEGDVKTKLQTNFERRPARARRGKLLQKVKNDIQSQSGVHHLSESKEKEQGNDRGEEQDTRGNKTDNRVEDAQQL